MSIWHPKVWVLILKCCPCIFLEYFPNILNNYHLNPHNISQIGYHFGKFIITIHSITIGYGSESNVYKKCSLCMISIFLCLGSHHLDFPNRSFGKFISRLQLMLQIHNEIEFTTLVYRCDHKVTHCTDSDIKSSSTLLFSTIPLYEALLRYWSKISPSKEFHERNNSL